MLTGEQLAQYEREGFVRLGQVMSDAELAGLQERINQLMMGEVTYPGMFFQLDSETGAYGDLGGTRPAPRPRRAAAGRAASSRRG